MGTVLIENERVRVTRWDFARLEDCTGWHRHAHDYAVVPLFDGNLRIDNGSETVISSLITGGSYFWEAGVEHDICNGNAFARSFIEVELLEASRSKATMPMVASPSITYCTDSPARMKLSSMRCPHTRSLRHVHTRTGDIHFDQQINQSLRSVNA